MEIDIYYCRVPFATIFFASKRRLTIKSCTFVKENFILKCLKTLIARYSMILCQSTPECLLFDIVVSN